jgi:lipoprotein NlpI
MCFSKNLGCWLFLVVFLLMQGCASSQSNQKPSVVGQLIIAEPLPINYKSEIALVRMSEIIQRAEITDGQRAQMFYDRGVIYDSVGLRSLARLDFNRALRLKPDMVEAYNFIGIHYIQLQEFTQAYDAFDSAIELTPEHEYAFLNRGIALYYGGRSQLAIKDILSFYQRQTDDPYRLLWLYLAERDVDEVVALDNLKTRSSQVSPTVWAKQIIKLYLNEISQQQFIGLLTSNVSSNKELTERLCEAYFYLGKLNQLQGKERIAANFFKMALSTNVYEFVEHRYAKLELDLMRAVVVKSSTTLNN